LYSPRTGARERGRIRKSGAGRRRPRAPGGIAWRVPIGPRPPHMGARGRDGGHNQVGGRHSPHSRDGQSEGKLCLPLGWFVTAHRRSDPHARSHGERPWGAQEKRRERNVRVHSAFWVLGGSNTYGPIPRRSNTVGLGETNHGVFLVRLFTRMLVRRDFLRRGPGRRSEGRRGLGPGRPFPRQGAGGGGSIQGRGWNSLAAELCGPLVPILRCDSAPGTGAPVGLQRRCRRPTGTPRHH